MTIYIEGHEIRNVYLNGEQVQEGHFNGHNFYNALQPAQVPNFFFVGANILNPGEVEVYTIAITNQPPFDTISYQWSAERGTITSGATSSGMSFTAPRLSGSQRELRFNISLLTE